MTDDLPSSPDGQNNDDPQQTNTEVSIQALLEKLALLQNHLSSLSPDVKNNDNPQQNDPDIASQVTKETALLKSHTQLTKPTNSKQLSEHEHRETGHQRMNRAISNFAYQQTHVLKKRNTK